MERERKRLTREESRKLTRANLLDSAAEMFARRGFHGASVEEIAEEAGYSRGAVYSNFSGKEEMFLALFDRRQERDKEVFFEALNSPDAAREDLERAIGEDRTWSLLELEFFLYAARAPEAGEKLAERYRAWNAEFSEFLEQWLAERDLDPMLDAEHLSRLITAVGNGLGQQALVDPQARSGEIYAAALKQLLSDASGRSPYGGSS